MGSICVVFCNFRAAAFRPVILIFGAHKALFVKADKILSAELYERVADERRVFGTVILQKCALCTSWRANEAKAWLKWHLLGFCVKRLLQAF